MSYFDLGTYSRTISTHSKEAQDWFDQGLIWSYAFNHEEAAACFERASKADSDCIMALWGMAYALGPNYNKTWEMFDEHEIKTNISRSKTAISTAKHVGTALNSTEMERALINAIQFRYQDEDKDKSTWNADYAQAMEGVYRQFGEDLDVAALYADALMNLTPWGLWELRSGEPAAGCRTLEAKTVLDRAIAQQGGAEHPGLLHLYIHLIEMSSRPEDGLPAADALRGLVPDAGHLHHMPTHLDVLCGDYRRVVTSNFEAIKADERWVARAGALNFYSLYRMHNYHFRIYGALFTGQSRVALKTAAQLEASLPDELLRTKSPPMADWLEGFFSMRLHVLIRFGRWEDIIQLELPQDEELYSTTTAMTHYAKGIAFANSYRLDKARKQRGYFAHAFSKVQSSRTLFNNTCQGILKVAQEMLEGELEYRSGNIDYGLECLHKAIVLSDSLPYDEPWGWMQPPRHAYGALLLEQGRVEDAMDTYTADLGLDDTLPRALQHPNNMWALHGYHECLVRKEGPESLLARYVKKQLLLAAASADVPIIASCCCRSKGPEEVETERRDFAVKPWRFNTDNS